jgi:vancomycin resistance protein YoaR
MPRGARIALVAGVALLVVSGAAVGIDLAISAGRIHPGVTVGGLDVGGMSVGEATSAIGTHIAAVSALPVTLSVEDVTWEIGAEQIGLSADAASLADQAYAVGRSGGIEQVTDRAKAIVVGVDLEIVPEYDPRDMAEVIAAVNEAVGTPPVDASVSVEGVKVTRGEPSTGIGVDAATAGELIARAFLSRTRTVTLQLAEWPPAIPTEAADDAYETALSMVSGPLTLYYGEKEWQIAPETIGEWIGFRAVETDAGTLLEAYIASEEVSSAVLPLVAEVGKPAKNATFSVSSGAVSVVPAEDGLVADAEDLATRLTGVLAPGGERRAELTMRRVDADITTEEAQAMGIVDRLATFTTEYASSNKPRVNNIHTLADSLNGTLIPPGGTFSFNETIGERTAAKGYQEAPAIVGGKLVPQLGGGICQVGTTIFNTVFFSGLPVVERKNHSQYISHYPTGRDATVSWGGPDFKFANDTPNWVLVAVSYTNSSITISLYGTDPGYEVTYTTGQWTNIVNPPVREIPDATLPLGSKVIEERGISGRTIVVTRTVTKDGAVIRTDTFKSVYRPTEEVVRVGTMAAPPPAEPTTSTP